MAEGFLRALAGDRFESLSAGYRPSSDICRDAIEAMREMDVDISEQNPKDMDVFMGQHIAYLVTLCDREKERTCPIFPGVMSRLVWPLEDPQGIESPVERMAAMRRTRDDIQRRVIEFVSKNT